MPIVCTYMGTFTNERGLKSWKNMTWGGRGWRQNDVAFKLLLYRRSNISILFPLFLRPLGTTLLYGKKSGKIAFFTKISPKIAYLSFKHVKNPAKKVKLTFRCGQMLSVQAKLSCPTTKVGKLISDQSSSVLQ